MILIPHNPNSYSSLMRWVTERARDIFIATAENCRCHGIIFNVRIMAYIKH